MITEEAFSGHCYDKLHFIFSAVCFSTLSLFLYALGSLPALPTSTEQYTRSCSLHRNASRCTKKSLPIYLDEPAGCFYTHPHLLFKHSATKSSHFFPLNHKNRSNAVLNFKCNIFLFYYYVCSFYLEHFFEFLWERRTA